MTDASTLAPPPVASAEAPEAPAKPEPVAVAPPEEAKEENGDDAAPPRTTEAADDAAAPATAPTQNPPPDDDALVRRLRELLGVTDLEQTSVRQLRSKLEAEFECELGEKKALIRETVDAYLAEKGPEQEEEGGTSSSSSSEEDDDERRPPPKKKSRSKAGAARSSPAREGDDEGRPRKRKGGGGGLQKPMRLSAEMSEFCGGREKLSRAQIVKRCWEYIKEYGLQDPSDRRKIMVRGELEKIFTPPITMFSMNKQISKHVFPDDD